jgi:iron complex outermembrane recepter protein
MSGSRLFLRGTWACKQERAVAWPRPINLERKPSMRNNRSSLNKSLLVALGGSAAMSCASSFAQQTPSTELERVIVTGSNIRRTDTETPSPVQVITADDLKRSGYTSVADVLHSITANGQGTLSQSFSGAFAGGAGGVSLRGLSVGATLVLIDGRRMAPYPIGDDGQRSFVDISNIPFDAVERIEVLKDGASAVYGSDAIAGVVNVILKRSFVGKTISADVGTSYKNDGNTYHVTGTAGFGDLGSDGHNFYIAGELRKQNQIRFIDRGGLYTQTDFTSTGGYNVTPGVPNALVGSLPRSGTGYVTDATGNIVGFMPGCDATKLAAGQCTYADNWSQIQPTTENRNLIARYTQNLGADWQLSVQGSYFQSKAQQVGQPSRAFAGGFQGTTSGPGVVPSLLPVVPRTSIPDTNPSYPTGTGLGSGFLRYTFLDIGPNITDTDARSTRLIGDLQGRLGEWDLNAAAGYTQVRLALRGLGYVNPSNLQAALNSTTEPYLVGGPNGTAVRAFVAPELNTTSTSKLGFVHVGAGRDLMQLPGGALAIAFGADYLRRSQYAVAPADVAAGLVGVFSNNFTIGKQTVESAYGELLAPITKELQAEAAMRYDHYNLSGGKASPKLGVKYTPLPELALRATVGRGFRAPGPAENGTAGQTFFAGTSRDPILCPNAANPGAAGNFPSQCTIAVGTVQSTNAALKPETSRSFTFGVIVEPAKDFSASLDFYSLTINNQIVAGSSSDAVRGTNFTPLPQVQPDGSTATVVPPAAPIAFYRTTYVNANSTKTSGVDLAFQWRHRFEGVGYVKSDFMVSHMRQYDLTINGATYRLAGTHGPLAVSGDTGSPKTRIQWANTFSRGAWSITGTINYISAFDLTDPSFGAVPGDPTTGVNDCVAGLNIGAGSAIYSAQLGAGVVPDGVKCKVDAFTTFDLYGRYEISKQLSLQASVLNLFNAGAPQDWGTYGGGTAPYNPSLHNQGAIGRYFNVGLRFTF